MAGIGTGLATLAELLTSVNSGKDMKETIDSLNKKYHLISSNGSITKLLSEYIVEPIIIATHGSRELQIFDNIVKLNTDLFCSFYLQAFQILVNQFDLDSRVAIGILSTDQSNFNPRDIVSIAKGISKESYNYMDLLTNDKFKFVKPGFEAGFDSWFDNKSSDGVASGKFDKDLEESTPLYGIYTKTLNLNISTNNNNNKHTIVLPIVIKSHIIIVSNNEIINMLKPNSYSKTFSYRLDEWRAGAITFKDLIFCTDLIDEYKSNKKQDHNGLLNIINSREASATTNIARHGYKGFEANYNMLIVTTDDKVRLDKALNGDILKENIKQELLTQAHAMSCSILDPDYERLNLVIRDIRGKTDVGFKNIFKRKDKNESELLSMMQALLVNKPLSL